MKKFASLIACIACALALCLAVAGCGSSGEVQTAGKISVLVPSGYTLHQGDITGMDETDETQCYIAPDGEVTFLDYYWIVIQDSLESAQSSIDMTKSINDATDLSIDVDGVSWTGCSYAYAAADGDLACGALCAEKNGVVYLVSFVGHDANSSEVADVLGSIDAA